jgi:GNAT superfamily N-acetyltransferase
MPTYKVTVACPIHDSFRVQQVAGMFDVPLAEKASEEFIADLPGTDENWQIGLIVGPSGSGKSTIAGRAFQDNVYISTDWPTDRAVVDCFGKLSVRRVVELFTAVGFGSPPSWIKPYHVLSNGECFRCDLARALSLSVCRKAESTGSKLGLAADANPLVVFDEFTSVVDRNVAKVCSAAIAKSIRRGHIPCRFVAVTCHYDVAEWLEPDWILDMAACELTRRRLRRPEIRLEIHRCEMDAWQLFKRHHYLNGSLPVATRCYLATWDGIPVNFCATVPVITRKNHRRFTRIVTLPDYQGIGIGMRVVTAIAEIHRAEGHRMNVTSSHPALIRHCQHSPLWKVVNVKKSVGSSQRTNKRFPTYRSAAGRAVVSFEYMAPLAAPRSEARDGDVT